MPKDWTEDMLKAYDNLQKIYNPGYINAVAMGARALPEYTDIINLYKAFMTTQKNFKVIHGLL